MIYSVTSVNSSPDSTPPTHGERLDQIPSAVSSWVTEFSASSRDATPPQFALPSGGTPVTRAWLTVITCYPWLVLTPPHQGRGQGLRPIGRTTPHTNSTIPCDLPTQPVRRQPVRRPLFPFAVPEAPPTVPPIQERVLEYPTASLCTRIWQGLRSTLCCFNFYRNE